MDFNNINTVSTPSIDIERVTVLEKRNNFILAYEEFYNKYFNKISGDLNFVKSRLIVLYIVLKPMLERRKINCFEDIKTATKIEQIETIFNSINVVLDEVKLTRLDNKHTYDETDLLEEMEQKEGY